MNKNQIPPPPPRVPQFHPVDGEIERLNAFGQVSDTEPITHWRFNHSMFRGLGVITFLVSTVPHNLAKYRMYVQMPLTEEEIKTIAGNTCELLNMKDGCVK